MAPDAMQMSRLGGLHDGKRLVSSAKPQARLLVVDDDTGLRDTLADFFELEGYEVLQAANVAEARRYLANGQPDLLLLDINMPGGDGLTFAPSPKWPRTPGRCGITARASASESESWLAVLLK